MRTLTFREVRLKRGLEAIPAAQTFRSARFDHVSQALATHTAGDQLPLFSPNSFSEWQRDHGDSDESKLQCFFNSFLKTK